MNKTKIKIIEAFLKEISENGYSVATMDDISSNAGVAKGTLYYHFKSKEEMFKYCVFEGLNSIKEKIQTNIEEEDDESLKLRALCESHFDAVKENKELVKIIISQLGGSEIRHIELRKLMKEYIEFIETYIIRCMEVKLIKKGDSYLMAYNIIGILFSNSLYQVLNDKEFSEADIDNFVDYILGGISVKE